MLAGSQNKPFVRYGAAGKFRYAVLIQVDEVRHFLNPPPPK